MRQIHQLVRVPSIRGNELWFAVTSAGRSPFPLAVAGKALLTQKNEQLK